MDQMVTGVLPPITPIAMEMYMSPNIPWFSLSDDHVPSHTGNSQVLGQLKSVTQLDDAKRTSSPDTIDPDRPPMCSFHPRAIAASVFRPCSHVACAACLGGALLKGSQCPNCASKVERFVGMKEPIPQIKELVDSEGDETTWEISQMEELARKAVDSGNITIIHLPEDRVPPLHRTGSVSDMY